MARGGFNMGGMNRNQMMAQARKMQEQLLEAQQKASLMQATASAGGGAVNDALESAESQASAQMSAVTGGLNIPGLF